MIFISVIWSSVVEVPVIVAGEGPVEEGIEFA